MPQTLKLSIEGMHCGGCVTRVTTALSRLDGVQVKQVEVGSADVGYDESKVAPQAIVEAVNKLGFVAREA